MKTTLAIIGGTGLVGQKVISAALAQGYQLKVLARDPNKVPQDPRIEIIAGDALDVNALKLLVDGATAVVSTLGPSGINSSLREAKRNARGMLCYNTSKILLPLLQQQGIDRYVLATGASLATPSDNNPWWLSLLLNKLAKKILGTMTVDRQQEYELLSHSDIRFTYARCPAMVETGDDNELKADAQRFQGGKVNITALGKFLVDQVDDQRFVRQAVYVGS